ncbi:MAG: hypothetical protein ABS75_22180 [Pelagibacterium sp. SCN 63-23]|nr:MAG: hypothetical protein ABS75_22180 [Pelagibacterium sp. SCN 63-23]
MTTPIKPKNGILIIDPQPHMAMLVTTMLRSIGQRDSREINEASQAILEMGRRAYDVIIIDDGITNPDAVELVRRIRSNKECENQTTPIIMMSAAPDAARITEARDAGVTEFLRKPFAANHLKSRLDTIASAPREFIEAEAYTGPDRRRRSVNVGDKDRRGS